MSVLKMLKIGAIMHFFGKDVTGVDNAWVVTLFCEVVLMPFVDVVFAEIEVFDSFGIHADQLVHAWLPV